MIRILYPLPSSINWDYLQSEIRNQYSNLISINSFDNYVAVYFDSEISEQNNSNIASIISNHNPLNAPYPPLDAAGALATLLVVLNVIPIDDAANVIHEEPDHLIAEAQAWSLGAA